MFFTKEKVMNIRFSSRHQKDQSSHQSEIVPSPKYCYRKYSSSGKLKNKVAEIDAAIVRWMLAVLYALTALLCLKLLTAALGAADQSSQRLIDYSVITGMMIALRRLLIFLQRAKYAGEIALIYVCCLKRYSCATGWVLYPNRKVILMAYVNLTKEKYYAKIAKNLRRNISSCHINVN